jgi:hypothetical protein
MDQRRSGKHPWIDNPGLEKNIDCLRGVWDPKRRAMVASFRTWDGQSRAVQPLVNNLPIGTYGVYVNGELTKTVAVASTSSQVTVDLIVGWEDVDLVLIHAYDSDHLNMAALSMH